MNISLGRNNTALLYQEGYVKIIGKNNSQKSNVSIIQNSNIIKVVLGRDHSGFV